MFITTRSLQSRTRAGDMERRKGKEDIIVRSRFVPAGLDTALFFFFVHPKNLFAASHCLRLDTPFHTLHTSDPIENMVGGSKLHGGEDLKAEVTAGGHVATSTQQPAFPDFHR